MAGAYTAKPDATVTLDIPPGWNVIWPHPGPLPPGYTPSYSVSIVAPASIVAGNPATAIVIIYDAGTHKTNEPPDVLNFIANLVGYDPFGGDSSFSINGQGFYTITLEVSTISADAGKEVEWLAAGDPFGIGNEIEDSATTLLTTAQVPVRIEISYTAAAVGSANASIASALIETGGGSGFASATVSNTNPPEYSAVGSGWSANGAMVVADEEINSNTIYTINISASVSAGDEQYGDAEISYDLSLYINDELEYTESDVLTASIGSGPGFSGDDRIFFITVNADGTFSIS